MDETERIRNMVAAGTITDAEADRLLSVLRDIDTAEEELAASGEAMESEARAAEGGEVAPAPAAVAPGAVSPAAVSPAVVSPGAVSPGAESPGAESPATAGAGTTGTATPRTAAGAVDQDEVPPAPSAAPSVAPSAAGGQAWAAGRAGAEGATVGGMRWLHLSLLAGDIDINSDPAVSEVTLVGDTGGVRLEPAPDGYTLRHERDGEGDNWVDRFLSRLRSGHVRVRLPAGYGVDLNVTAGDVELSGVPYLRGRLTSGDLSARGLKGIDLVTSAGDIDLEMTLTEGKHNLRATAGDVDIRLGAGSSVAVSGSVSIGNASVRAPDFEVDRRGIGQRFEGRVGDGAASLDLHVTTGNLHVKVDDER